MHCRNFIGNDRNSLKVIYENSSKIPHLIWLALLVPIAVFAVIILVQELLLREHLLLLLY